MNIDTLVRMANSIGDYFAVYPDRAEAQASIAKHIRLNWTPKMRAALYAHATAPGDGDGAGDDSLQALVLDSIRSHPQLFLRSAGEDAA